MPCWALPRPCRAVLSAGATGILIRRAFCFLVEVWRSTERMQRHLQSEDFRLVLALMDLSAAPPEFKVHQVLQISARETVMAELSDEGRGQGG